MFYQKEKECRSRVCTLKAKNFTTMKSSFAPKTRILSEESFIGGTGSDALSFLRSNNGILELSVISF